MILSTHDLRILVKKSLSHFGRAKKFGINENWENIHYATSKEAQRDSIPPNNPKNHGGAQLVEEHANAETNGGFYTFRSNPGMTREEAENYADDLSDELNIPRQSLKIIDPSAKAEISGYGIGISPKTSRAAAYRIREWLEEAFGVKLQQRSSMTSELSYESQGDFLITTNSGYPKPPIMAKGVEVIITPGKFWTKRHHEEVLKNLIHAGYEKVRWVPSDKWLMRFSLLAKGCDHPECNNTRNPHNHVEEFRNLENLIKLAVETVENS